MTVPHLCVRRDSIRLLVSHRTERPAVPEAFPWARSRFHGCQFSLTALNVNPNVQIPLWFLPRIALDADKAMFF